jgi:hypothetical protein
MLDYIGLVLNSNREKLVLLKAGCSLRYSYTTNNIQVNFIGDIFTGMANVSNYTK